MLDAAMDRYARGDDRAFEAIYDALAPRLFGYLLRQTRSHSKAEDLVQQTFLQMHRARGQFVAGAAATPWAFAIARRLFIDGLRRGRREVVGADENEDGAGALEAGAEGDPEALARAKQLATALARALATLPENHRAACELLKQEGVSLTEAAQVLGTTTTAVKLRAHRAYVALREQLGDRLGEAP